MDMVMATITGTTTMDIITIAMAEVGVGVMESGSVWGWGCWVTA
jgi:hypothetical protein